MTIFLNQNIIEILNMKIVMILDCNSKIQPNTIWEQEHLITKHVYESFDR